MSDEGVEEKIDEIGEMIEFVDEVEMERRLGNNNDYYDGSGFFNYDDYIDWSNRAIKAHSCYNSYVLSYINSSICNLMNYQ